MRSRNTTSKRLDHGLDRWLIPFGRILKNTLNSSTATPTSSSKNSTQPQTPMQQQTPTQSQIQNGLQAFNTNPNEIQASNTARTMFQKQFAEEDAKLDMIANHLRTLKQKACEMDSAIKKSENLIDEAHTNTDKAHFGLNKNILEIRKY